MFVRCDGRERLLTENDGSTFRRQSLTATREALDCLRKDAVLREVLGDHIFTHFLAAKEEVWADYNAAVHDWELERYLATY